METFHTSCYRGLLVPDAFCVGMAQEIALAKSFGGLENSAKRLKYRRCKQLQHFLRNQTSAAVMIFPLQQLFSA